MAGKSGKESKKNKSDLGDVLTELATLRQEIDALKVTQISTRVPSLDADAEQVARRASAFTPTSRARLIETLLTQGPQTPPQLGEAVGLATGSLYHHLREIVAAGIAIVEAKHYRLTPEGERLARVFFLAS